MNRPSIRWLIAFVCSVALLVADYFLQTRVPPENPADTSRQSLFYRLLTWTVPPEGHWDIWFAVDTLFAVIVGTVVLYFLLTRWQRRRV